MNPFICPSAWFFEALVGGAAPELGCYMGVSCVFLGICNDVQLFVPFIELTPPPSQIEEGRREDKGRRLAARTKAKGVIYEFYKIVVRNY
jgi:hypothetical protein